MLPQTHALKILREVLPTKRLALLGLLAVCGSLTEGIGLVLLVPALRLASGEAAGAGLPAPLDGIADSLGFGGFLCAFVVLITARSLLVQGRILYEARLQIEVTNSLRDRLFSSLMSAQWRFLAEQREGDLMALVLNTVDRAALALQYLLSLGAAGLTLLAMMAAALTIAPLPAIALGLCGFTVLMLYARLRRRAAQQGTVMSKTWADVYGFYSERINSLRAIKIFGVQTQETREARQRSEQLLDQRLAYQRGMAVGQVVLQSCAGAALALAVWLGLERWDMALSALLPLVALAARSVPLLGMVQVSWQQWAYDSAAFGDFEHMVAKASAAAEPQGSGAVLPPLARAIALKGVEVRFATREQPALTGIDLEFPAGSTTFVTGPSGAGKSTLADLIGGLIVPDAGQVEVDGLPLADAGLAAWRRQVAYVQQEPMLFDATIRENLLWAAPDADEAELRRVLTAASASFVLDLPEGLDTRAGPSGRQFSGGEKQRIVLARSLLRKPSLLILDEATSALDAANEAAVHAALGGLRGSLTLVIIGHRGSLADLADHRVELAEGRVVYR